LCRLLVGAGVVAVKSNNRNEIFSKYINEIELVGAGVVATM
jgi:hypothetical protein